jgi:hypothetical protein
MDALASLFVVLVGAAIIVLAAVAVINLFKE